MPRKLSNSRVNDLANDLIGCLQMWDVGRVDAYAVAREMKYILQNMNEGDYKKGNPLAETTIVADRITNDGLEQIESGKNILELPRKIN